MIVNRLQRYSGSYFHSIRSMSTKPPVENAAKTARAARRAQAPDTNQSSSSSSSSGFFTPSRIGLGIVMIPILCISYAIYDMDKNPEGEIANLYQSTGLQSWIQWIRDQASHSIAEVLEPSSDKLLPDFPDPAFYGPTPPGAIAPPLLVVDLERTLIGSVYDVSMGWRHAKRPGVDKFIQSLSQYYEIVIFSENDTIIGPEVWEALDKDNRCHHLSSNAGELRDNKILKRLDKMNRDVRKIILIDDSEIASQLFPRNTLLVRPYTDLADRSDTVLLDLIPLLQAFIHEDCKDFRDTIDHLGTHRAEEAVVEYQMRVSKVKAEERRRRNMGLGGFIRQTQKNTDEIGELAANQTSILNSLNIVGSTPEGLISSSSEEKKSSNIPQVGFKPSNKPIKSQKSSFFEWLERVAKDKEEMENLKRVKMSELYQKRMEEKMSKQNGGNVNKLIDDHM